MDDQPKTFAERLELESNTRFALQPYLRQAHPVVVVLVDGGRFAQAFEEEPTWPTPGVCAAGW
jgi:hypothetical protein